MAKSPTSFDEYFAERSAPVRAVLEDLRALVHRALPGASEGFKWGAPVFDNAHGVNVVYLYGGKDHANVGFLNGADLDDPKGLLEGTGKTGRHVKVLAGEKIPKAALTALLRQCADMT